jgi:hypothetical protein
MDKIGADEARSPGDQDGAHICPPKFSQNSW